MNWQLWTAAVLVWTIQMVALWIEVRFGSRW